MFGKHISNYWIVLLILYGCVQDPKSAKKESEISKIELATGGCLGACQYTATSIDSSLHFKYYGGKFSISLPGNKRPEGTYDGYYECFVTRGFWDTLNLKLQAINYKKLRPVYSRSRDDESLELIIHYGDEIKHVSAQSAGLPDSVYMVVRWIEDSYKRIKLTQSKDSLTFEAHIQKGFDIKAVAK
ncbi:DUF6438 domain-containing protein [Mucilaginibacter sp. CAU 1740]|uniref:DUF6438 domain-containing protein n=1 Tax=Mucilaginibacter sp. CAU 1740 TaxID=3140365 RepID=UPI00325C2F88